MKAAWISGRSGPAAIDLCAVAAGRAEAFYELLLCPWDHAAAGLIIEEAGGFVESLEGGRTVPAETGFDPGRQCRILGDGQKDCKGGNKSMIRRLEPRDKEVYLAMAHEFYAGPAVDHPCRMSSWNGPLTS